MCPKLWFDPLNDIVHFLLSQTLALCYTVGLKPYHYQDQLEPTIRCLVAERTHSYFAQGFICDTQTTCCCGIAFNAVYAAVLGG